MNTAVLARPGLSRALLIALAMLLAAGLAVLAKPTRKLADTHPKLDLETMVPRQFGAWRVDTSVTPVLPSPDLQAVLDKTYDQVLARTYIDEAGRRVMLSIAYGGTQHEGMQTHKPEICYPAQGFEVTRQRVGQLVLDYGVLPIKRLFAVQGRRNEPITYWLVVGEQQTSFGLGHKLATLKYGLTGRIPDGMLVRVSSIDADETRAYALQDGFLRDMLAAMNEKDRVRLLGTFGA